MMSGSCTTDRLMEEEAYLGRYRICREANGAPVVAASGFGATTYKAEDIKNGRAVLVQILPIIGLRPRVREKLETEALAAKQIVHLNVHALLDFGPAGNEFVYVTEYFDGASARAWLTAHGPMPIGDVLRIAAQAVGALGAANFHGIVHYALHPGNVIVASDQSPEGDWPLIKVANFLGLAPSLMTAEASGAGPHDPVNYASPEQLQDDTVDFRSEVYSLGCILWFLLTGVPPFAGAVTVESAPGVPDAVKEMIAQMLATDSSDRQFDPHTLQAQIEKCIMQLQHGDALARRVDVPPGLVAAIPDVIQNSARRSFAWKPLAFAAFILLAVALAALALPRDLRPTQLFARKSSPIGVPIGIPDPPPSSPSAEPAIASPPVRTSTGSPPVLVSTASAEDDNAEPSVDSPKVAAIAAPADSPPPAGHDSASQSAPTMADNLPATAPTTEPSPPSESPVESSPPVIAQTEESAASAEKAGNLEEPSSAAKSPEPTSTPRVVAHEPTAPSAESGREKSRHVAKEKKHPKKVARYPSSPEDSDWPPPPPHPMRAQYLGTTPDGEPVFAAPEVRRYERRWPRRRRVIRESIDGLPVLPALPPGE